MIIDANAYWGRWGVRTGGVADVDEFLRSMDTHEIDVACVTSLRGLIDHTARGNAEIFDLVAGHPDRFRGVVCVNPKLGAARIKEDVERIIAHGIRCVRIYPAFHNYALSDADLMGPLMHAVEAPRLIVYVTMGLMPYPSMSPKAVEDLAARHKNVPFVLCGVNYREYYELIHLMAKADHVYMELSVYQRVEGTRDLVERFGAGRILLGTGYGLFYPGIGLTKVRTARISEEAKAQILGENAEGLIL